VIGFQYFSGTLADNGVGAIVLRRYARHDGSVGNTQVFDTIDFEIAAWALGSALTVSIYIGLHKFAFSRRH
jgi:hypothetical protein